MPNLNISVERQLDIMFKYTDFETGCLDLIPHFADYSWVTLSLLFTLCSSLFLSVKWEHSISRLRLSLVLNDLLFMQCSIQWLAWC